MDPVSIQQTRGRHVGPWPVFLFFHRLFCLNGGFLFVLQRVGRQVY